MAAPVSFHRFGKPVHEKKFPDHRHWQKTSAGGALEALEHFLSHVPKNSGMAFVIVQHLDPTRKGIMPELLQRTTGMKVIQVKDRTSVQPNCVYVIPPNKDMSILHGVSCTCSNRRRRADCACRLIFFSAPWRKTSRNTASA
jgi:chemotaxis response regulator CheB